MMWHVYTDGSALSDESMRQGGSSRYPGGWAAVIEHGSDGYVIRGREAATTNVRMELRAVIEGLKQVPDGEAATLHFDCSVIHTVRERWKHAMVNLGPDGDLWRELALQFDRVPVTLDMIGRGPSPVHRRAHVIAHTEAKAQAAGLPAHASVLSPIEKKERRRAAMARAAEDARADDIRRRKQVQAFSRLGDAFVLHGLTHARGCEPGRCVSTCPIWLNFGVRF